MLTGGGWGGAQMTIPDGAGVGSLASFHLHSSPWGTHDLPTCKSGPTLFSSGHPTPQVPLVLKSKIRTPHQDPFEWPDTSIPSPLQPHRPALQHTSHPRDLRPAVPSAGTTGLGFHTAQPFLSRTSLKSPHLWEPSLPHPVLLPVFPSGLQAPKWLGQGLSF